MKASRAAKGPSGAAPLKTSEGGMSIDKELLEILACPKCKGKIRLTEKKDGLVCDKCRLVYPIKDEIPVMLVDEAAPLK